MNKYIVYYNIENKTGLISRVYSKSESEIINILSEQFFISVDKIKIQAVYEVVNLRNNNSGEVYD